MLCVSYIYIYIPLLTHSPVPIPHQIPTYLTSSSSPILNGLIPPDYHTVVFVKYDSSKCCHVYIYIYSGWWYTYLSEKYEFVSWDDDIPNIYIYIYMEQIVHSCSKPPTRTISNKGNNKSSEFVSLSNCQVFKPQVKIVPCCPHGPQGGYGYPTW